MALALCNHLTRIISQLVDERFSISWSAEEETVSWQILRFSIYLSQGILSRSGAVIILWNGERFLWIMRAGEKRGEVGPTHGGDFYIMHWHVDFSSWLPNILIAVFLSLSGRISKLDDAMPNKFDLVFEVCTDRDIVRWSWKGDRWASEFPVQQKEIMQFNEVIEDAERSVFWVLFCVSFRGLWWLCPFVCEFSELPMTISRIAWMCGIGKEWCWKSWIFTYSEETVRKYSEWNNIIPFNSRLLVNSHPFSLATS